MINNKLKFIILIFCFTASLSGCSRGSNDAIILPLPTVEAPVPDTPSALPFYVVVNVIDSESGNTISATIRFFEAGEPSTNVVNLDGEPITELVSSGSGFNFAFAEGAELSDLTMLVSAEGYISNSVLILNDTTEPIDAIIALVRLDETKVAVGEIAATAANGQLTAPLSVTANAEFGSASVEINADVVLQDADGNAITNTNIELMVITADSVPSLGKVSAADLIPEGANELSTNDVLVPAGYMTVEMFADGIKIRNFSEDISLTLNLPNTYEMVDDTTVQTGDTFNVSSYDEDTGKWVLETEPAIVGNANEFTFPVNFVTKHLTGFLLSENQSVCSSPISYNFTGDAVPTSGLYVKLSAPTISKRKLVKTSQGNLYNSAAAAKLGFAADTIGDVIISDASANVWGNVEDISLCGTISADISSPIGLITETLIVTYTCSNAEVDQNVAFPLTGALIRYAKENEVESATTESNISGSYPLSGLEVDALYNVSIIPIGVNIDTQTLSVIADGENETYNVVRDNCALEEREVPTGGTSG
jgi:hypothetical protein